MTPIYRFLRIGMVLAVTVIHVAAGGDLAAQSGRLPMQRAAPPKFDSTSVSRVFFRSLDDAFRGPRPTRSDLRQAGRQQPMEAPPKASDAGSEQDIWSTLVSAPTLEDEVKRIKLRYDGTLTSPGAFKSGGYQDARLDLSVLATLFAVISDYSGDVRWKDQAAAARDLTARTAQNCAAGSTQVFNEAKLRRADLQDLVSGAAITISKPPDPANDWSAITERTPMMQYIEQLLETLEDESRDAATAESNVDSIRRAAESVAMVGEVLVQEGMDDFDDEDYALLSRAMSSSARSVVDALQREDFESVRAAVGSVSQSCADCHEQYR